MKKIINLQNFYKTSSLGVLVVALCVLFLGVKNADATITSELDLGQSGPEVTELQTYLAKDSNIYPSGSVTGYFGALTQAGVERFQVAQNIVTSGTPSTTGYGRVGPATAAKINSLMGNTTWNPSPSGDVYAPIMSSESVSVGSRNATITWNTNEVSNSRVMYNTYFPFLYATAPSVSDIYTGTVTSITLSNLLPNTTYFYVRESVDVAGNVMWTTNRYFQTSN